MELLFLKTVMSMESHQWLAGKRQLGVWYMTKRIEINYFSEKAEY